MFGAPRRNLLIEARRTLGFARTGGGITEVIDGVIQSLLDEGQLRKSLENIHVEVGRWSPGMHGLCVGCAPLPAGVVG